MNYDYEDYWEKEYENRERRGYYEALYGKVKEFFKFRLKDNILDIGGGNGQFSNFIKAKNVTIIDISGSGLKFAKNKFKYKTLKQDICKKWGLKNQSFDVCFCNEILEHLKSPSQVIAEAYRILKKQGILYIGQPNMYPDGKHHLKKIDLKYLKRILKENGFKIEEYLIKAKYIDNKFKELSSKKSFKANVAIFFGFLIGSLMNEKQKRRIARKFPNFLGGFYYIKAMKI